MATARFPAASRTRWLASASPARAASSMAPRAIAPLASRLSAFGAHRGGAEHERVRADQRAQAAAQAAGAGSALRVDGDVADLAGGPGRAPVQAAAHDVARSDAGPDLDVGDVLQALPRAPPVLGQRSQVGVVVDQHRHAEALRQEREAGPSFPGRQGDLRELLRVARIDRARHRHADPHQPLRAPAPPPQALLHQLRGQLAGALRVGAHRVRALLPDQHLPSQIRERHRHVAGAEIDADQAEGVVLELEHDGAAPAAGLTRTSLDHEPGCEQLGDGLGHRRAREVGATSDLRARDGSLGPDESKQAPCVRPAGTCGQSLRSRDTTPVDAHRRSFVRLVDELSSHRFVLSSLQPDA